MAVSARIVQVNRKPRTSGEPGLPKLSVASVRVDVSGVEGDFNIYRHERKGDTPDRALLVYPRETMDELATEGWPVRPGDLGENLTTQGVAYDSFQPGTTWRAGPELVFQITEPCNPCKTLRHLPYVGEKVAAFQSALKGRRGWYARVLAPGVASAGDELAPTS